jgi:hypothetical protein
VKVTIVPRGTGALGYAQYQPNDQQIYTRSQLLDMMCMTMGGRYAPLPHCALCDCVDVFCVKYSKCISCMQWCSQGHMFMCYVIFVFVVVCLRLIIHRATEEVFFGRITTGAQDDLQKVTDMAYGQVTVYGMNERIGMVSYPRESGSSDLSRPYSQETASIIDDEVRKMVQEAYHRTVNLIREKRPEIEKIAKQLLAEDVLSHDDMTRLLGPRPYQEFVTYEQIVGNAHVSESPSIYETPQPKPSSDSNNHPPQPPQPQPQPQPI